VGSRLGRQPESVRLVSRNRGERLCAGSSSCSIDGVRALGVRGDIFVASVPALLLLLVLLLLLAPAARRMRTARLLRAKVRRLATSSCACCDVVSRCCCYCCCCCYYYYYCCCDFDHVVSAVCCRGASAQRASAHLHTCGKFHGWTNGYRNVVVTSAGWRGESRGFLTLRPNPTKSCDSGHGRA
jgi:hypothetical protein